MKAIIHTAGNDDWNFKLSDNDPAQPHMLQFALLVVDAHGIKNAGSYQFMPEPQVAISDKAGARLGFADGAPKIYAGAEMTPEWTKSVLGWMTECDEIIAHAAAIHRKMLRASCIRMGLALPDMNWFCTMTNATEICALPSPSGRGKSKWPTLDEAFKHFYGADEYLRRQVYDAHEGPNAAGRLAAEKTLAVYQGIMDWRSQPAASF